MGGSLGPLPQVPAVDQAAPNRLTLAVLGSNFRQSQQEAQHWNREGGASEGSRSREGQMQSSEYCKRGRGGSRPLPGLGSVSLRCPWRKWVCGICLRMNTHSQGICHPSPGGGFQKRRDGRLPWQLSDKESTCHRRRHGFNPWSGKNSYATEQLSPRATTTEVRGP